MESTPESATSRSGVVRVPTTLLRSTMVLARPILDRDGRIAIGTGTALGPRVVQVLRRLAIQSVPVVATAVGGTPEVVDAASGCLVPPRDPVALAAAIRSLARDAARRLSLGQAGRARVQAHFTLDRMVEDFRKAYEH